MGRNTFKSLQSINVKIKILSPEWEDSFKEESWEHKGNFESQSKTKQNENTWFLKKQNNESRPLLTI